MVKNCFFCIIALLLLCGSEAFGAAAGYPTFSLHKLGASSPQSKTLLVIGGIQGDEPGGFHAASILTTHYTITNGTVWIVPNLNFPSIINRSRGLYGDLNRKFAAINQSDPEYPVVERIKSIISNEEVDLVLNLHDGSGFYREDFLNNQYGPQRWGQSVIIDQESINTGTFGELGNIARDVTTNVNSTINDDNYAYRVKNTKTAEGNEEMAKTLTFFAINQGKPAFGIEASKNLPKSERVFYHLLVLENFMKKMGISFHRNFELTADNIHKVIIENRNIALYDNRIFMDMQDIRNQINYFPLEQSGNVNFWTKDPLIAVVEKSSSIDIYHGNEHITTLVPQYFNYDTTPPQVNMIVDGYMKNVRMGSIVKVSNTFKIITPNGYRANAIGYSRPGATNEAGVTIERKDFSSRFSLNEGGSIFRVEFYKTSEADNDDEFAGMVLVKFEEPSQQIADLESDIIPSTNPDSRQGR